MANTLPESFYESRTDRVARALLGQVLCVRTERGIERALIVETEAYLGITDRACHAFQGRRTKRVEPLYLSGGHAYVYFIYGMYFCLNVVTRKAGRPEAVLIRAVEPLKRDPRIPVSEKVTNGPGKLCRFYGINLTDDRIDLTSKKSRIWIEQGAMKVKRSQIETTARIGIDSTLEAKDLPLRFFLKETPHVSKFRSKKKPKKD